MLPVPKGVCQTPWDDAPDPALLIDLIDLIDLIGLIGLADPTGSSESIDPIDSIGLFPAHVHSYFSP